MNVTYEHKKELTFIGFHTEIAPEEGNRKCPEFWDREFGPLAPCPRLRLTSQFFDFFNV